MMPLGMGVGFSPEDFVLDGDPVTLPKMGAEPRSPPKKKSAHVYCGQTAGWIKMPLGTKVVLSPGDSVRWEPSPVPQRGWSPSPIFGPFLWWPNGWRHQDATWHGGRPQPKGRCVRWGPSPPSQKGGEAPLFSAHVYCGQTAGWIKMALGMEVGLGPVHIVLDGDTAPLPKKGARRAPPPNFPPIVIVAKRLDASRWYLVWR